MPEETAERAPPADAKRPSEDAAPKTDNAHEERWLRYWEEQGIYRFDRDSDRPVFSIDTPPPTVSGRMHIGHAYSYNQMDFVARYKRMRGFNLFYPFGFDDNGLPTERYTERQVGVRLADVGRKEFIRLCLEETKKAEAEMERSWRRIGTSCDWSLAYRTIDPHAVKTSQASFVELHGKDRVYRAERPTIWCPDCATAIAQVEAEDRELASTFNDIVFDLVGPQVRDGARLVGHARAEDGTETPVYHQGAEGKIVISTTRPELVPACVAVFVHPDDERTRHLVGRKVRVPVTHQEVDVLTSDKVDPTKGTGVVMNCTFGDMVDIEWWQANRLPLRVVIDAHGRMAESAGQRLRGKSIAEAREAVLKDLDHEGRLLRQTHIKHVVNVHERCGTPIEFLVTKQWFVRYLDLKDEFLRLGAEVRWHPDYMRVRFDNWVKGLQWDWCISRQRYFGVPFPVWYCGQCGAARVAKAAELPVDPLDAPPKETAGGGSERASSASERAAGEPRGGSPDVVAKCASCGSREWKGESDVMDTWATSSLTPQIALKWVEDDHVFDRVFPMSLRTQAHEIISFWAFNTIVKAHFHHGSVPWRDIMISGFVKLGKGKKMSKSKGNVVEPLEVIEEWSADALRYWSATGANLGEDIIWNPKDLTRAQRLVTKMRNVAAFAARAWAETPPPERPPADLPLVDRWILTEFSRLVRRSTELWDQYDYVKAQKETENFLWHVLADHYLELVKHRLYGDGADAASQAAARWTLWTVTLGVLKLFAPVLAFVTEDVYQSAFRAAAGAEAPASVHVAPWPEAVLEDEEGRRDGQVVVDAVAAGRAWKASKGIALGASLGVVEAVVPDAGARKALEAGAEDLRATLKAERVVFAEPSEFRLEAVSVEPNFATIGPKYRARGKLVVEAIRAVDPAKVDFEAGLAVVLPDGEVVALEKEDYRVVTRPTLHGREVETVTAGPVTLVMPTA